MITEQSPIQLGLQVQPGADTQAHGLHQEGFLNLSTPEALQSLIDQGKVMQLSITPELDKLTELHNQGHDGYLIIQLPMVGMVDYLHADEGGNDNTHTHTHINTAHNTAPQAFGSVLGLNQFSADSQQLSSSRPDFVVAKDIIGNEYEILISPEGKIIPPEEGAGKFSLLSEIKLMYSLDQILEGRGLSEGVATLDPASLYLLPPPGFQGKYAPVISVSQTQDDFSEKELSSRKIPILLQSEHDNSEAGVLSESSLYHLSKYLYTEYDFTKAILSGDEIGVKKINGLNDFALSPEAIGVYYDLWLNGVVTHQISTEDFLSRINPQDLLGMNNFDDLGLSPTEQLSMQAIVHQAKLGDFSGLHALYEPVFQHEQSAIHLPHAVPVESSGAEMVLNFNDVFASEGASFKVNDHQLDLSNVLNNLSSLPNSPDLPIQDLSDQDQNQDQNQGQQVHITYQQSSSIGSADTPLPDLSHYFKSGFE